VRHERLDQELPEDAFCVLNLLDLAGALSNPGPRLSPGLVKAKQAALATTLDQLIGLCDELGALVEEPRVGDLGLVEDIVHVGVLGEVQGGESGRRVVLLARGKRARLDDGSPREVIVDDGLAIGFEDALRRHVCKSEQLEVSEILFFCLLFLYRKVRKLLVGRGLPSAN